MSERIPNEEISKEQEIREEIENVFSLIDEYSTKSKTKANSFLVKVYIAREEDNDPYSLIINSAVSNENGKPEVLVVNILNGLTLTQQFVTNVYWENGKPKLKGKQLLSLGLGGKFDELEIATVSKEAISQTIQKLDIEKSAKIFPFNSGNFNGIS